MKNTPEATNPAMPYDPAADVDFTAAKMRTLASKAAEHVMPHVYTNTRRRVVAAVAEGRTRVDLKSDEFPLDQYGLDEILKARGFYVVPPDGDKEFWTVMWAELKP